MDSSPFCWLSLRPPIFNSSLFTSFGFFTLRSSLFTSIGFFTLLLAFPSAADFQFFTLHLADALEEG